MGKNREAVGALSWHDGNLVDIGFAIDGKGRATVTLVALLYESMEGGERKRCHVSCEGVSRFSNSLDVVELKGNMFAGNIANGYLKDETLWVYFTDGLLEVRAKKFRVRVDGPVAE